MFAAGVYNLVEKMQMLIMMTMANIMKFSPEPSQPISSPLLFKKLKKGEMLFLVGVFMVAF